MTRVRLMPSPTGPGDSRYDWSLSIAELVLADIVAFPGEYTRGGLIAEYGSAFAIARAIERLRARGFVERPPCRGGPVHAGYTRWSLWPTERGKAHSDYALEVYAARVEGRPRPQVPGGGAP